MAGLVGRGASENAIGAALTAAEAAGVDRVALQQAVHEGGLDRERQGEVAVVLDRYRALLDQDGDAPAEAGPGREAAGCVEPASELP